MLTFSFTMEFCGRDGYIDDFFIRPAFRRRGLGREVLRRVEDAARREGVKVLFLEAHDEIKPHLINFYEWAGYARRPCRLMRKCL